MQLEKKKLKFIVFLVGILVCGLGLQIFNWQEESRLEGNLHLKNSHETSYNSEFEEKDLTEQPEKEKEETIKVHVTGEVRFPGVYELEKGARKIDAVEMARGTKPGAGTEKINLAQKVQDGQKIVIPPETDKENKINSTSEQNSTSGKININTAGSDELKQLSGIGIVRAEEIIEYRKEKGAFNKVEELTEVSGIGEGILSSIQEDLTY